MAAPKLRQLVKEEDETAHLGVLIEGEVLSLLKNECSHAIRMASQIGKRGPVHAIALGKVLLAHLPSEERERIYRDKNLSRFTRETKTFKTQILPEKA